MLLLSALRLKGSVHLLRVVCVPPATTIQADDVADELGWARAGARWGSGSARRSSTCRACALAPRTRFRIGPPADVAESGGPKIE